MPNESLSEIAVILDRSGSMSSIQADMVGGFASFIREQQAHPDPAVVSLYQFDTHFETVYEEVSIQRVPNLVLSPRSATALLDAMGRTIGLVGARLARKPDHERPGKVVVLVITDGQENASTEFSRQTVAQMVTRQRVEYSWQFAFLGANLDSFAEAGSLGMSAAAATNFQATSLGVRNLYRDVSYGVGAYRTARGKDAELRIGKTNTPL